MHLCLDSDWQQFAISDIHMGLCIYKSGLRACVRVRVPTTCRRSIPGRIGALATAYRADVVTFGGRPAKNPDREIDCV